MGANSSRLDFSPSEEEDVSDDKVLVKSPDDLMATGRPESPDSYVSLKSDWSKAGLINFKDRVSPRLADFSSSEEEDVSDDEGFFEPPDDQLDFSPSEEEDVSDDEGLVKSPDDLMAHRSVEAFGSSLTLMNDSFIRPRQDSLPRMVLRSMEAFGSGLSLMSDSFIRTGQHSPPREEMNQELSSEVGWKHD